MPAMTSILAATALAGGGLSLLQAKQQSDALKAQGDFENAQAQGNAAIMDLQAQDAERRGSKEANRALRQGRQVQSEQRAALAAQGLDVNSGSAADIQDETAAMAEADYETIKNNAWREAWGFKSSADTTRAQGKVTQASSRVAAHNTLLTGGINALGSVGKAASYASAGAKSAPADKSTPMSDEFQMPEFGSSLRKKKSYSLGGS